MSHYFLRQSFYFRICSRWSSANSPFRSFSMHNSKASFCLKECTIDNEPASHEGDFQNKRVYRIKDSKWRRNPPLVNALKAAAEESDANFTFPGHNRGEAAPSTITQLIGRKPFLHDLSEVDNLFTPEGPILEAQKQAAQVFGASETWFLVGGTTCGIQAAIMSTCKPGDTLILPRNAHISAISGMVLTGVVPKYIFPTYDCDWSLATSVSPSKVEEAIRELELEGIKPAAVFLTSPTYQGICSDVKGVSMLCHSRGIPLIVDEAHGAHFGFHKMLPISALEQGADVVVQSTHKVLLSLTQSSMLHHSGNLVDRDNICRSLQCLQSTSPSPLLLASLDATTNQLREDPKAIFDDSIHHATRAKSAITHIRGISILDFPNLTNIPAIDPLRVTLGFFNLGISGYEADDFLFKDERIISEIVQSHSITFPFLPGTSTKHVDRLVLGLKHLSSHFLTQHRKRKGLNLKLFKDIQMQLTPREAFFANKRKVDIDDVEGMICGELISPYPPGIPIIVPGEIITKEALNVLLQAKVDGAKISGACDPLLRFMLVCDSV